MAFISFQRAEIEAAQLDPSIRSFVNGRRGRLWGKSVADGEKPYYCMWRRTCGCHLHRTSIATVGAAQQDATFFTFYPPRGRRVVRADLAHKPSSHMNFLVGQLQGPSEAEKQGVRMVTRSILIRVLA